jgi:hypothetical protein
MKFIRALLSNTSQQTTYGTIDSSLCRKTLQSRPRSHVCRQTLHRRAGDKAVSVRTEVNVGARFEQQLDLPFVVVQRRQVPTPVQHDDVDDDEHTGTLRGNFRVDLSY